MNIITKLATKMLAVISIVAMVSTPVAAQGLGANDMAFAFGGKAGAPATVQKAQPVEIASARGMTLTEMQDTEGAFWPWVIRGAVSGAITGAGAGAVSWSNGNRGWTVVKHTAIGFATGAGGGVASRWQSKKGW